MELAALTPAKLRTYIDARKAESVSPSTISRELCVLSAAINYAKREWEWDIPNPVTGRKLKEPEARTRWLSRGEADALIRAAENEPNAPHLSGFIRLALHTGMRSGEMLWLEWSRVDLRAGLIHLEAGNTKTGKRRAVPPPAPPAGERGSGISVSMTCGTPARRGWCQRACRSVRFGICWGIQRWR